jgi:hypothetical protein
VPEGPPGLTVAVRFAIAFLTAGINAKKIPLVQCAAGNVVWRSPEGRKMHRTEKALRASAGGDENPFGKWYFIGIMKVELHLTERWTMERASTHG